MNPKEHLKQLRLIFWSLVAGVTFFLLTAVFLLPGSMVHPAGDRLQKIMEITAALFAFAGPAAGILIARNMLSDITGKSLTTNDKLIRYRKAFITKTALFEAAAFFNIVGFMLFGSLLFVALAIVVIVFLTLQNPAVYKISRELNIKPEELV